MDFVQKVVEKFGPGGQQTEYVEERRDYYGGGPPQPEGPPLPRPWVSRWVEQDRRWLYVNEMTGEQSWERPYGEPGYGGAPAGYGGGGGYSQGGYGGPPPGEYYREEERYQEEPPKKDHSVAYGVAGAAAGLVGGALLMHEGEEIHDEWEGEKEHIEQRVEDFPENAAEWTGDKVGEAEYEVDKVENAVENFPENTAEWVGDKVGGVERFGDEMENAYDEGRDEGRDGW
ncbi:uncharacterized protein TRUGW13939_08357 [Talaromyces rugulosus]|uniref:WW domain-containing protein n=1 Tax=Talaromyces rugulosus TaxID=121627 RepID=A0A7H8R4C8_TALRU|nr:uncharacterized protein TRUGW13939_08357 [Talaromyces rugulosus]QKX61210.1 hypothetical protein TRUGW13939_08357 [Talaromyces rugulosus]